MHLGLVDVEVLQEVAPVGEALDEARDGDLVDDGRPGTTRARGASRSSGARPWLCEAPSRALGLMQRKQWAPWRRQEQPPPQQGWGPSRSWPPWPRARASSRWPRAVASASVNGEGSTSSNAAPFATRLRQDARCFARGSERARSACAGGTSVPPGRPCGRRLRGARGPSFARPLHVPSDQRRKMRPSFEGLSGRFCASVI